MNKGKAGFWNDCYSASVMSTIQCAAQWSSRYGCLIDRTAYDHNIGDIPANTGGETFSTPSPGATHSYTSIYGIMEHYCARE